MSSLKSSEACHEAFMDRAIELALRGKGATAPNPSVGALLVREGEILAQGWHQRFGGPHAEVECLKQARERGLDPAGCDLYVTLEPCNHHGKTPPCTLAVLEAKISRVFIGCLDPNPDVNGGGAQFLRAQGLEVYSGVLEGRCRDLIDDFRIWKSTRRTYNYLKLASTLDGKIAARNGHSAFVSCEASRSLVQDLRGRVDVVLVGGGTLCIDNPRLTRRGSDGRPLDKQPLAAVVTGALPDPNSETYLLRHRPSETIFFTSPPSAATSRAEKLKDMGVRIVSLPQAEDGLELGGIFNWLRSELKLHNLLCEGGGRLAMSLLTEELVDEFWLFLAPKVLGDEHGKGLASGREVARMDQAGQLRYTSATPVGEDILLTLKPMI